MPKNTDNWIRAISLLIIAFCVLLFTVEKTIVYYQIYKVVSGDKLEKLIESADDFFSESAKTAENVAGTTYNVKKTTEKVTGVVDSTTNKVERQVNNLFESIFGGKR